MFTYLHIYYIVYQNDRRLAASSSPAHTNLVLSLLNSNNLHSPFFITPYPYRISPFVASTPTMFPPDVAIKITPLAYYKAKPMSLISTVLRVLKSIALIILMV